MLGFQQAPQGLLWCANWDEHWTKTKKAFAQETWFDDALVEEWFGKLGVKSVMLSKTRVKSSVKKCEELSGKKCEGWPWSFWDLWHGFCYASSNLWHGSLMDGTQCEKRDPVEKVFQTCATDILLYTTEKLDGVFFCFNDIFDFGRAEPSLHVHDKDKQIMSMVWT